MVEGDQRPADAILDRFKLEAGTAVEFAPIRHGVLDRRELQKVVLALTWSGEQQQHEPNGLQTRVPPCRLRRRTPEAVESNLSLFGPARNGL